MHFQVISKLETSCLQSVRVDRMEDEHTVIHLEFNYINPNRRTRDYVMESYKDALVSMKSEILPYFLVLLVILVPGRKWQRTANEDAADVHKICERSYQPEINIQVTEVSKADTAKKT